MARKKYIRRRIVKLPSIHERFHAPEILDNINEILAAEQKRYKYVRFGITTDLKAEYDLRKQRDDIQWSSMKVYFYTPYRKEDDVYNREFNKYDNYNQNNIKFIPDLFDTPQLDCYVYVMVGRRKKPRNNHTNRQLSL